MESSLYRDFYRRARRNLLLGTALSVLPGAAFYFFVFSYSWRQLGVLAVLAFADLAAFLPLDIAILRASLRPVEHALAEGASQEARQRGLARLLDSPRLVLLRVFGPHAICFSAGITLLVVLANRWLSLGIDPRTFPFYWVLNLTVVPIAHVIYEFAAMEREIQPLALELAQNVPVSETLARPFTLEKRMRIFFPLLALAPIVVVSSAVYLRVRAALGPEAHRLLFDLAAIGGACAALFLYLMYVLGRQLHEQTAALIAALDRLGRGDLGARAQLYTTSEFGQIAAHINSMALGLSERQRLRDLFGAYMTSEVATALLARGEHDTGRTEKRYVAILFVDVRGFTAFSRERPPEVIVGVLNRFFEAVVGAIAESGGTVNKYLGDGLLAIFGAPVALENPCGAAVSAALQISKRVRAVNHLFAATGVPALKIGIGVHAGEVVVGSIGSPKHKLEYTVIGDPVNLSSRIEGLNKQLGTEILISDEVYERAGAEWQTFAQASMKMEVKGVEQPVKVWVVEKN
ncbi:MAG TPA: adenylate/guanylate cyclase domain-containing protein [Terriglobales bacterium]|nr:adenylate/guanylate cyclase domain-containing protein [Terriglobales bacterium]